MKNRGILLYGKQGEGRSIRIDDGTGFVKYDKYMNKYRPKELKEKVPNMSKTKLKRMLYSLINRRDRLKNKTVKELDMQLYVWGSTPFPLSEECKTIEEVIFIISDEIAHREFAKLCPDTDTKQNGDKKE